MRSRTQTYPVLTSLVMVIAVITGAALATEGGLSELVSAMAASQNMTVRGISGPFNAPVSLVTDRGYVTTLADTGGEVRLVTFIYAHCPGVCPLTVQTLQALERQLAPGELSHLGVLLLSLDATDKPEALRGFAVEHAISSARWTIARTVRATDTDALAAKMSLEHRGLSDGTIDHSAAIALVDAQGRIVTQTWETTTVDPDFIAAVRSALAGAHGS